MNSRRGHLSRKIPNVKLKPRPGVPVSSSEMQVDAHLQEDDSNDNNEYTTSSSEKPLSSFVFCSTGILNRHELYKKAIEMGASYESSFTDNVTHLLATDFGSPKYNCAVKLGAVIVTPAFVDQSYLQWLDGANIDTDALAEKHALKAFANLTVSMSGIGAGPDRLQYERALLDNGANVSRDLHKQCTHLVTENTTSNKVKWAKSYNSSNGNRIKIVWTEWISACTQVKGRLPEEEFSIEKERPSMDAYRPSQVARPLLARDTEIVKKRSFIEQPGNEDLEKAVVKKSRVAKESLVEGILSQTSRSPRKERPVERVDTSRSLNNSTSFFRDRDSSFITASRPLAPQSSHSLNAQPASSADQKRVFTNYTFSHRGFEKSKSHRLDLELEKYGASVTNSLNLADLTIVPFNSGNTYMQTADSHPESLFVTECWVERCMYEGVVVPFARNPLYRPITLPKLSSEIASSLCLTFSGLDECERTHIMRFFKALGVNTRTSYPRDVTHLVSVIPPRGKRYERALEWKNPVIDVGWVWELVKGHSPPLETYLWEEGSGGAEAVSSGNGEGNINSIGNHDQQQAPAANTTVETDFFASQEEQPSVHAAQHENKEAVTAAPPQAQADTHIPLRKTLSTNPFRIRSESSTNAASANSTSGAGLHDSILQLLKQEGEKIYPAHAKLKKRPRLKRTSTGENESRGGSETPAPAVAAAVGPLEQHTENAHNIAAGRGSMSEGVQKAGDSSAAAAAVAAAIDESAVTKNPSKAPSSPLSTPSPPPSMSQLPSQSQSNGLVNESLRIMYDDPEARNERRRILQALTNIGSSDPRNSHTANAKSDENESADVMYRFAKEDFEKPIAETRPKRGAAREGNEKMANQNQKQYDPTQLDEF